MTEFSLPLYRFNELSFVAQQWANNQAKLSKRALDKATSWFTSNGELFKTSFIETGCLTNLCQSPLESEKSEALEQVFEYLLQSEQQQFMASPEKNHIYFQLMVAKHGLKQAKALLKLIKQGLAKVLEK